MLCDGPAFLSKRASGRRVLFGRPVRNIRGGQVSEPPFRRNPLFLKKAAIPANAAYERFREKFHADPCRACALSETRTNLVLDRGNPAAKVFFLGEAPGAQEDIQGRSFVGRSGKLLDAIMRSIGLDPEKDVFIASVLKCRPPKNRLPKTEEVAACAPHLARQFDLVSPAVVVPLGATAFSRLKPGEDFAASVGNFLDVTIGGRSVPMFPIYHPAYLLYSPKKKSDMRTHVAELKKFLTGKKLLDASRACLDF